MRRSLVIAAIFFTSNAFSQSDVTEAGIYSLIINPPQLKYQSISSHRKQFKESISYESKSILVAPLQPFITNSIHIFRSCSNLSSLNPDKTITVIGHILEQPDRRLGLNCWGPTLLSIKPHHFIPASLSLLK